MNLLVDSVLSYYVGTSGFALLDLINQVWWLVPVIRALGR